MERFGGNVQTFSAKRFVAPRVKISFHVGKCLRTEDIFGRENVSTRYEEAGGVAS